MPRKFNIVYYQRKQSKASKLYTLIFQFDWLNIDTGLVFSK